MGNKKRKGSGDKAQNKQRRNSAEDSRSSADEESQVKKVNGGSRILSESTERSSIDSSPLTPTTLNNNNNKMTGSVSQSVSKPVTGNRRRTLTVLVLILMLDLLAFTCILPLFPSLMDFYAAQAQPDSIYSVLNNGLLDFRHWIGVPDTNRMNSVFFAGFLGSVFSFLQFVSSPVVGTLSDVFGRKNTLMVVTAGSLCANIIWLFAYSFPMFVLFRVFGGLCKSSVSIATAIVADVFAVNERGKGMALIGMCFSFGFLFGPLIGAVFARSARLSSDESDYPFAAPALFAVALSACELALVVAALPETLPPEKRKTTLSQVANQIINYVSPRALFEYRAAAKTMTEKNVLVIRQYGYVYFMFLLLYSGLEFTLSFFTHERFNYESIQQGRMYFFAGLIMVFVQGSFVRRIKVDALIGCAQCGLAAIVPAYVIIAFSHSQSYFFVGLALYAFASACVVPCLTTLVSNLCVDSDKGAVLGVLRSQGSLARALGPFIAAICWFIEDIYVYSIFNIYWYFGATVCYCVGGCLLLAPFLMLRSLANQLHGDQVKLSKGA